MDSYFAILQDFTKEVKLALKRSEKSSPDLAKLQDSLRASLEKVKERHLPPSGKKKKVE
jgi:hypothetical protein